VYVENIRDALSDVAPESAPVFQENAARYIEQLQQLDVDAKQRLAAIPAERRKAMVSHDALAYLGHEYGIEFVPLLGISSQAEPSARDVANLVQRARAEHISAIFLENAASPALAKQLARETGAKMGGTLYTDALAEPGHEADTYLGMMQSNLRAVEQALLP
jgi:zinc/manganese transport system substrate-binding protein